MHALTMDLKSVCATVARSHIESLSPRELAEAHARILALPEEMEAQIGCETALKEARKAAEEMLGVSRLIGDVGWPVSPAEVGRRGVRVFKFKMPWDVHLYMNGSLGPVRRQNEFAECMLAFNAHDRWGYSVYPSNETPWVSGRTGEEDDFGRAFRAIQERLQEMTDETMAGCHERRREDQERRGGVTVQ